VLKLLPPSNELVLCDDHPYLYENESRMQMGSSSKSKAVQYPTCEPSHSARTRTNMHECISRDGQLVSKGVSNLKDDACQSNNYNRCRRARKKPTPLRMRKCLSFEATYPNIR
jgi:hypothetical protein